MLSFATDGYYWAGRVIPRSLGGAEGGCPEPPTLQPERPVILAEGLAPDTGAEDVTPDAPAPQDILDLKPQLISTSIKPSLSPEDDDPC